MSHIFERVKSRCTSYSLTRTLICGRTRTNRSKTPVCVSAVCWVCVHVCAYVCASVRAKCMCVYISVRACGQYGQRETCTWGWRGEGGGS